MASVLDGGGHAFRSTFKEILKELLFDGEKPVGLESHGAERCHHVERISHKDDGGMFGLYRIFFSRPA